MSEHIKDEGHFERNRLKYLGGGAVAALIIFNILNGESDGVEQFTESDVVNRLNNRLAEATAENNTLIAQNSALEKQNIDLEKRITDLEERFDDRTRQGGYEDRRPYWDRSVRGPSYGGTQYGRPPFHPSEYRWYGAGGGPAYPIEYGRPYGSPYRTAWWDDRIYQQPHGYGPQYGPQYGSQYGGGRGVRLGFDSRGAFNVDYRGSRFGIRFGGRL